jgi:hypothetical protein
MLIMKQLVTRAAPQMVLLVLLLGCHSAARPARLSLGPASPESVAGCYRMVIGNWANTGAHHGVTPPMEFRLDTASAAGEHARALGHRTVTPPIPGQEDRFTSWSFGSGDTLRVWWSTGYVGGGYTLKVQGDSVFGRATTRTDVRRSGIPDPTAPAHGARAACG